MRKLLRMIVLAGLMVLFGAAEDGIAFTAARNELLDLLPLIIPKYFAFQS